MATQTRPFLMTGAALASAAAIAVASPAIAPNITPTPNALSAAQVELTTFADLMSIPAAEWSNVAFGENPWGGYVSVNQTSGLVIQPYANTCDNQGGCYVGGISGVAYLALDALLNGDSLGYQPTFIPDPNDPTKQIIVPGTGYTGWKVSAVNYLFEPSYLLFLGNGAIFSVQDTLAGVSASTQYILQATLGQLSPVISDLIFRAYLGFYNVTIAYDNILQIVAGAALNLPVLGGFVSNSILAYLGRLQTDSGALYLQGLSGTLQYWLNLATGAEPWPGASTATAAAAAAPRVAAQVAAQVAAAVTSPLAAARSAAPEAGPSTPEVAAAEVEAPKAGDTAPADDSSTESTPASTETTDSASTDSASTESASESTPAETPAETPADTTPAVDTSSSAVADSAPAATKGAEAASRASKRPVRSAAERATKKVAAAVSSGAARVGKRVSAGR